MERAKKFKFNILDVVIIIVAVACIAGLAIRSNLTDKFSQKEQTAHITFEVCNILEDTEQSVSTDEQGAELTEYSCENLKVGDVYYCDKLKGTIGTLESVDNVSDAVQIFADEDGIQRAVTVPYRKDITATLSCDGYFDDGVFFANGVNRIVPNESYEVYSLHRKMTIRILSIEPAN